MTTNSFADYDTIKNQRCEVKDDYDHENSEIEYVIENVLFERQQQHQHGHQQPSPDTLEYENLSDAFNSVLLNSCSCTTNRTISEDQFGRESGGGVTRASAIACGSYVTCLHGGNYISASSHRTELVLNPNRLSKDLIYECSVTCKCDPGSCDNRLVQFGPRPNLQIIASKLLHKQYALQTNAPIPRGAFVCEYAGEILTRSEAHRRMKIHESIATVTADDDDGPSASQQPKHCNKMNYVLCLNEYSLDGENVSSCSSGPLTRSSSLQQTFVDPRLRGNIGRYLNHSCQPNCEILSVRVDCPIPKIAIFAKRDIEAGEELCFHYGGGGDGDGGGGHSVGTAAVHSGISDANAMQVNKSIPCLCGSDNCENFLPSLEF